MGESLSPDRVFDFPVDELEPHPAYDFFAPAPLPGYVGNPNNNNGWLEADDYLLGALEAMVDEQMVVPAIKEVAEPVAEAEEEQVIAPAVDMKEGQMDVPVMDIEDDLAALFSDDDASDGFDGEEVWEVNEKWLMAPTTPPPMLAVPPSSVYEVSDAEVAAGVTIEELGPGVYAVEGQVQVIDSEGSQWPMLKAIGAGSVLRKNHAMSDKSSPLKRLIIEINVWVKLSEGENIFTPSTDSHASNPTPIDCMERVSCESL
ncbi:hypothetical protein Tco_0096963 [Tanacetum coccineum]